MVNVKDASCLDYPKFVISALLLIFSSVCTGYAIVEQKTDFWKIMPGWAALLLFLAVLFWLGVMEGLQVALVELKRQDPSTYRHTNPHAFKLGQVAMKNDNVERFLMGRQMFVVFIVFFAAKLTTIHSESEDDFLFPIPDWFRSIFLETGILSCILVVIVAQLMPQIIAAKHPIAFLELWIMRPGYYACIFLESTGITHITWVLSHVLANCFGMNHDNENTKNSNMYEQCITKELNSIQVTGGKKLGFIVRQETADSAFSDTELIPARGGRGVLSRQETEDDETYGQEQEGGRIYSPN